MKKILIVEDNKSHLDLIKQAFLKSHAPFEITYCTSVTETISYLGNKIPDLIVSDCRLPDGHGEFLLDEDKVKGKVPVVYMSSQGNELLAVSLIKKGALDYLVKDDALYRNLPSIINRAFREWDNILARKKAEENLAYAESKYKLVTDSINDLIWELSVGLDSVLFISPSVSEFLGYSEQEFIATQFDNIITAESRQKVQNLKSGYKEHLRQGSPPRNFTIQTELEFIHKDGSIRWGEVRGFLTTDDRNRVTSINGVTRDITIQKAAEKQLKIQEAYFQTLIEEAPLAIVILNKDDTIRQVNKAFIHLFEYDADECIGHYINDLIVPDNLKQEGENLAGEILTGKYISAETIRHAKSGKNINVAINGGPVLFDDKYIATFGIYKDITLQKRTEENLQKISERLILATSAASIGIWDYDIKSRKLVWDKEMYKLHEIPESSNGDLMKIWEESVIDEDKALMDFIFTHKSFHHKGFENVYRLLSASRNIKYIRLFARVHFDDKREPIRLIGCCLDITSQMENAELSKQVEISNKVAYIKQQFVANMSHEIRSPVTGILGMADLLMKTELNPKQKFYVETLISSSASLLEIVNDILDLSKIEAGKMAIKPEWFSLKETGESIFNLFHALAEQKNIQFSLEYDKLMPRLIYGDKHRISQIITNLVSNAIKFTEKGWVKIMFNCIENHPDFVAVELSVQDSGIGISEKDMEKLFNLFSQVDNSDTRSYEGSGLGLAISQRLAELMHAKITVVSKPDQGSKFSFRFVSPKTTEVFSNHPQDKISFVGKGKEYPPCNILLVEDKKTNQMVISMMLEEYGHKVEIASNGMMAIEMIKPGKYDFVFMDIQMPIMDGLTAVRKLRASYPEDQLPVIVGLSAKAMEGDPEYYITRGMNDYLTKPVSSEMLQQCIIQHSGKRAFREKPK